MWPEGQAGMTKQMGNLRDYANACVVTRSVHGKAYPNNSVITIEHPHYLPVPYDARCALSNAHEPRNK
jgi:hypothetical protein